MLISSIINLRNTVIMIVFLSITFAFHNEVKAQCGPCENADSVQVVDPVTGCTWTVQFCWTCNHFSPFYPFRIEFKEIYVDETDPACNMSAMPYNLIIEAIINFVASVSSCTGPPCEEGRIQGMLVSPMCYKYTNIVYPNGTNYTRLSYCNEDLKCVQTFSFCVQYFPPPVHLDLIYGEAYTIGNENACADDVPIMPPPGMTYQMPWVTNCFKFIKCP